MYIAHKREDGATHPLKEHLLNTAEKAASFARPFEKSDVAYLCGVLHDIGKYSKEFQNRIQNDGKLCDHSTAGAQLLKSINPVIANLLGYVITGHHSGLLNHGGWGALPEDGSYQGRLKKEVPDFSAYRREFSLDLNSLLEKTARQLAGTKPLDAGDKGYCFSFLARMIFSCLVDADFLDTEEFMKDGTFVRGVNCSFSELENKLTQHVETNFKADSAINQKRREIYERCLEKAKEAPGVFKLSVPTGSGKTISSMAFALRHIRSHPELRRIIYVIPFTSIIEQNAKVFCDILGKEYVLEHHSNYDFAADDEQEYNFKKLASENWDIPIVVTTNVQFFESIYGNKSSKLRKLHNIANSVIILDEVQMLPASYMIPCAKALEELVNNYRCSVVLCSATQPEVERFMSKKVKAEELCGDIAGLKEVFNKTKIQFIGRLTVEEVAKKLQETEQSLLIVNTKKQARKLYEKLRETVGSDGVFHLSTYMCPANRFEKLDEIKRRISPPLKEKCIVVSTSLIEAGVDVDFPVVFRAVCGLDSIIQAAGRCNRERRMDSAYTYVFDFADADYKVSRSTPFGNYLSQRQSITELVARDYNDVTSPEAVKAYFDMLFSATSTSELDKKNIVGRLNDAGGPPDFWFDFADIARDFAMIEDNGCSVIVPYNDDAKRIITELEHAGVTRDLLRSAQKYTVRLNRYEYSKLREIRAVKEIGENIGILLSDEDYSKDTGLTFPEALGIGEFI